MKRNHFNTIAAWLLLFTVACSEETPDPLKTAVPNIPAPFNLTAVVSATRVTLAWETDTSVSYDEFAVYRSEDGGASFTKVGTSSTSPYADDTVRTGTIYIYQVAGVQNGVEGSRSKNLVASASAFTVSVNNNAAFTNARQVQLGFSAPGGTQLVRFGETMDLSNEPWVAFRANYSFTLSVGDGVKTVYAAFTDQVGHETEPVADDITLDTVAAIQSLTLSPSTDVTPGATLNFVVTPVGGERDGVATIDIENFGTPIEARDDGTLGDTTPDDGIYERAFASPISFRGKDLRVRATFTDAAGNQSDDFEFNGRLSFTDPSPAVTWLTTQDIMTTSMRLRWTKSDDLNFSAYEIYRDTNNGVVRDAAHLITEIRDANTTFFDDSGLDEAENYYYVIFVVNDLDDATPSTELVEMTADEPPTPVVLDSITSVGPNQLTLTWSQNNNSDFAAYRIYRRTNTPGVTENDLLVQTITDKFTTFYDDTSVTTGSNTYYYRVFVVDGGGNVARSNEVSSSP